MKPRIVPIAQSEKAYAHLRENVLNGDLNPGYPISEVELSERLNMSRTPIREAIHRLVAEGVLVRLRGRGTFVRSLSREEIRSAYEYAEGLEGMVAFLVAQIYEPRFERRILEPIEAMEAEVEAATAHVMKEDVWEKADRRFHDSLYDICPNRMIVDGLKGVYVLVQLVRMGVSRVVLDRRKSTQDHRDTATAIMARDANAARFIMQRHWERIRADLMRRLI